MKLATPLTAALSGTKLKRPKKTIAQRQSELRDKLWPGVDKKLLWNRRERDGFTTMPRTMPLMLGIMDGMSKGQPVSSTYLELWCRAYDECFVTLAKPEELAFCSGFRGQRATDTWRRRLRRLQELGFIKLAAGPSGTFSYALVLNPYLAIKAKAGKRGSGLTDQAYNTLQQRAADIGADDLD